MEISRILRLPKNVKGGHIWIHTTYYLCINTENVWSNKSVRRLDRSIERPAKTFKGQPKLPSGDIATPWGLVNSPRLRPLLPTFNTKSSSIGLFREQALPIKDLKKKNNNRSTAGIFVRSLFFSIYSSCMRMWGRKQNRYESSKNHIS